MELFMNKVILAPMVRVSKLPMRLLALDFGADLVYCEEIVDFKMLETRKVENKLLGTTDFLLSDDSVAFQTCPQEKNRLVFQMGTSNAKRAVKVAKMVEPYVAAIDINMGCPKEFSTKEGMGAALLDHPETYTDILSSLVKSVSLPITCKIRIKPKLEDTLKMIETIEKTGVSCITVHGRTRDERPRHANHDDVIAAVVQHTHLPVIANGGSSRISTHSDIASFKASTKASSVMLARVAMYNPSIFQSNLLPVDTVTKMFLKYAVRYDSHPMHMKYVIQQLLNQQLNTPIGQALLQTKTMQQICSLWQMEDYYKEIEDGRKNRGVDEMTGRGEEQEGVRVEEGVVYRVVEVESEGEVFQMDYKYDRKDHALLITAKMTLYNWTVNNKLLPPVYKTILHPTLRTYRSVLKVNNLKFTTSVWNKSDKMSQRSSARVCLMLVNLPSISALLPHTNNNSKDNNNNSKDNNSKDNDNNSKDDHVKDDSSNVTTKNTDTILNDDKIMDGDKNDNKDEGFRNTNKSNKSIRNDPKDDINGTRKTKDDDNKLNVTDGYLANAIYAEINYHDDTNIDNPYGLHNNNTCDLDKHIEDQKEKNKNDTSVIKRSKPNKNLVVKKVKY